MFRLRKKDQETANRRDAFAALQLLRNSNDARNAVNYFERRIAAIRAAASHNLEISNDCAEWGHLKECAKKLSG
jgi:hypothetical protein